VDNKRELRSSAVSVGKRLREAREKKSLTIEQVQKQTKIHSTVLTGLEDGRPSETLTDTYIRSFLKQYAQFLGINSVDLIKEYFPARTENTPAPSAVVPQENILSKETQAPPKFLYMTGLAVAAIISLILLVFIVGKVSTAFKKAKPFQQQKKASLAVAKKKVVRSAKVVRKNKPAAKAVSEAKELVPKNTPLSLEMKVKEAVLVKLKKDGILLFYRVLPSGLIEKTIANKSIELDIAKAGSVELTLNGRPIDLQGKNVIVGLQITRKGVRIK
jgi:cytoskeletal protein RodZ